MNFWLSGDDLVFKTRRAGSEFFRHFDFHNSDVMYRVCARDVTKFSNPKLKSHSSGIRGTKSFPVYNFPAQWHPSFGNHHMAVRDITGRSLLSKNIPLSCEFWPF